MTNNFPTLQLKTWYEEHRPVGLGVMGLADLYLKLGVKYGSEKSISILENILEVMQVEAYKESKLLGDERGIPLRSKHVNRRNITTLSIAPTGSIAMIADCSHSIEPIFGKSVIRTDERGEIYYSNHPYADESYFISSHDVTWQQHVKILTTTQKYVDAGVSKTINMNNDATVKDVLDAYTTAWQGGAKGITVYRDGSRDLQVIKTVEEAANQSCPNGVCEL